MIAEEEAMLANIVDWTSETAEQERAAAAAAAEAEAEAEAAEAVEAARRLGEMGQRGAATAMGIVGNLKATGWAGRISKVYHWEPPLPEVTDWVFDLVDDVEVVVETAVGEAVTLLHPPLPLVGVSIETTRGCQQNDSPADG